MLRQSAIRLALLASLTLTGAHATNITYSGDDPYRSFDIWINADGSNANVIAGIAILQVDGFTTVDVVCVDFFVGIGDGIYSVNLLGPNAISNGTRVAWMLRNTLPSIRDAAGVGLGELIATVELGVEKGDEGCLVMGGRAGMPLGGISPDFTLAAIFPQPSRAVVREAGARNGSRFRLPDASFALWQPEQFCSKTGRITPKKFGGCAGKRQAAAIKSVNRTNNEAPLSRLTMDRTLVT